MHHRALTLFVLCAFLFPASAVSSTDKLAFYGLGPDGQPLAVEALTSDVADDGRVIFHADTHDVAGPPGLAPVTAGHHGDVSVPRPEFAATRGEPLETRVRELVRLLAEGPSARERMELHAQPIFPDGTRIDSVVLTDANVVELRIAFPREYVEKLRLGEEAFDSFTHLLSDNLFTLPVSGFMIYAPDDETGEWAPIETFAPEPDWESGPGEPDWGSPPETWIPDDAGRRSQYPHPSGGRPTGSLTNRTVYLNAGHGWTWRGTNYWGVQRGQLPATRGSRCVHRTREGPQPPHGDRGQQRWRARLRRDGDVVEQHAGRFRQWPFPVCPRPESVFLWIDSVGAVCRRRADGDGDVDSGNSGGGLLQCVCVACGIHESFAPGALPDHARRWRIGLLSRPAAAPVHVDLHRAVLFRGGSRPPPPPVRR